MIRTRVVCCAAAAGLLAAFCVPSSASAQVASAPVATSPWLRAAVKDALANVSAAQDPQGQVAQPMPAGGGRVFNPDMSVIANFLGVAGKNPNNTDPTMSLSEVEMSLQRSEEHTSELQSH